MRKHRHMSYREAYWLHRNLWGWLARNPGARDNLTAKEEWPLWKEVKRRFGKIHNNCLCCHMAWQGNQKKRHHCRDICMVEWPAPKDPRFTVGDCDYLFLKKWEMAKTPATRFKYAEIIRDLPVKQRYHRYLI